MFERFTNRARRVVVLAQEESRRLDHNYIGTEHILLGLLHEGESIAARVLTEAGITHGVARAEVEQLIGRGKSAPGGHIPFTPRAKKTLELSLREALQLGHNYIGPEHLLLGLIREGDGVAARIMREHADLATLHDAVVEFIPATGGADLPVEGEDPDANAVLRWLRSRLGRQHGTANVPLRFDIPGAESPTRGTPAAEAVLREAAALAGPLPVGSHHLLLAALADPNSAASATLAGLVDLDELKEKLRSAELSGTSDEPPERAGRRQMALQVSDEVLTIVLTDPVIVAAARNALQATQAGPPGSPGGPEAAGDAGAAPPVAANVIRGDHPGAENLSYVWLELRKTLESMAGPGSRPRKPKQVKVARRLHYGERQEQLPTTPAEPAPEEGGPGEGGEASPGEA